MKVDGNLWIVVNSKTNSIVYKCAAPNRVLAYKQACKALGEPPYTTKQIKKMGFKAVKVTEIVFK